MGTSIQDYLLSSIVAPSIQDPNYAASLTESFSKINSNFNKLLATPFLQGADAKNFKLEQVCLFKNLSGSDPNINSHLSDWGKQLVYAILKDDVNQEFNNNLAAAIKIDSSTNVSLATIRSFIRSNDCLSVHPEYAPISKDGADVFPTDSILKTPYIYAYATRDDANEVLSQFIAQYYRFIDARLGVIDLDITEDEVERSTDFFFDDLSCFLVHQPSAEKVDDVGTWARAYLTPTIYFDRETETWAWKISGIKTGITAQGVKGKEGDPGSKCRIVACSQPVEDPGMLTSNWVLDFDETQANPTAKWVKVTSSDGIENLGIHDKDIVMVLMFPDQIPSDETTGRSYLTNTPAGDIFFATCRVSSGENNTTSILVYYNKKYSLIDHINNLAMNSLLDTIGENEVDPSTGQQTTSFPRGLWIRADESKTRNDLFHMAYAKTDGYGRGLHIGVSEKTTEYKNDEMSSLLRMVLDSYMLHTSKLLLTGAEDLNQQSFEEGESDRYAQRIADLARNMLNVYGNSYFKGDFVCSGTTSEWYKFLVENFSEFDIKTKEYISLFTNGEATINANSVKITFKDKFEVTKGQGDSSSTEGTIMKSTDLSTTKDEFIPRETQDGISTYPALEIPFLLTPGYARISVLDVDKERIGGFCIIDRTAMSNAAIKNDFGLLKKTTTRNDESVTESNLNLSVPAISRSVGVNTNDETVMKVQYSASDAVEPVDFGSDNFKNVFSQVYQGTPAIAGKDIAKQTAVMQQALASVPSVSGPQYAPAAAGAIHIPAAIAQERVYSQYITLGALKGTNTGEYFAKVSQKIYADNLKLGNETIQETIINKVCQKLCDAYGITKAKITSVSGKIWYTFDSLTTNIQQKFDMEVDNIISSGSEMPISGFDFISKTSKENIALYDGTSSKVTHISSSKINVDERIGGVKVSTSGNKVLSNYEKILPAVTVLPKTKNGKKELSFTITKSSSGQLEIRFGEDKTRSFTLDPSSIKFDLGDNLNVDVKLSKTKTLSGSTATTNPFKNVNTLSDVKVRNAVAKLGDFNSPGEKKSSMTISFAETITSFSYKRDVPTYNFVISPRGIYIQESSGEGKYFTPNLKEVDLKGDAATSARTNNGISAATSGTGKLITPKKKTTKAKKKS